MKKAVGHLGLCLVIWSMETISCTSSLLTLQGLGLLMAWQSGLGAAVHSARCLPTSCQPQTRYILSARTSREAAWCSASQRESRPLVRAHASCGDQGASCSAWPQLWVLVRPGPPAVLCPLPVGHVLLLESLGHPALECGS